MQEKLENENYSPKFDNYRNFKKLSVQRMGDQKEISIVPLSTYLFGIGGDSLTIRHGDDLNEIDAPGRLCGDLSDWVPLNATIHITYADLNKQG